MKHLHLFSHGTTHLVVDVLGTDAEGPATCRVVRPLYRPGYKGKAFWRSQHDQPSPGDEIFIPRSELRRCPFNVRLRAKLRPAFDIMDALVILSLGFLVGAVMLFCLTGPAPKPVDSETIRLLSSMDNVQTDFEYDKAELRQK